MRSWCRCLASSPVPRRLSGHPPGGSPIETSIAANGVVRERGSCVELLPVAGQTMTTVFEAPRGGFAYAAQGGPVAVSLGRFGDVADVELEPTQGVDVDSDPGRLLQRALGCQSADA